MKAAKITVGGVVYFLVFDGEAMFTIRDIYDGTKLLLETIEQDTRESFAETCKAAAILAERGELIRRRLGYEPGKIPESDDFALFTPPSEIVGLKNTVIKAISLGYGREVTSPGGGEVDEGLEELNQKKHHEASGLLPYRLSLWHFPGGGVIYAARRGFRRVGALFTGPRQKT